MKRLTKTTFILSCFLYFHSSPGQNKARIDSLLNVLRIQQEDTSKVGTLNELAWELCTTDASGAIGYATQAITLSDSLAFKRGRITAQVRLGQIATVQKEYEKAEQIYLDVLKAEMAENYQYGIGRVQSLLSSIYRNKGDLKKALDYSMDALKTFETINRKPSIALAANNIGTIYEEIGAYERAIQYLNKSLEIRRQFGNQEKIGFSLLNIGSFYNALGNYAKSIENLNESKAIFEKLNNDYELAKVYNNLGNAYFGLERYGFALRNYHKSLSLKQQLGLHDKVPDLYNNIGAVYDQKNDLDTALEYYLKSNQIHENNTGGNIHVDSYSNIGDVYRRKKDHEKAITYYQEALKSAQISNDKPIRVKILKGLSICYENLERYDTALKYRKNYSNLKDSIDRKEAIKLTKNYENEQQANIILEQDKEILTGKNKRREILTYSLIAGMALLSVLFFAILKIRRQKQNIKLAEKDRQIKTQEIEDLLKDQELKFKDAVIEGQEKERKRIAKDLHDSLGSMLSTVKMYFKTIEENIENLRAVHKNQYEKANDLLDDACKEVRKIAYNMNEGVLMDFGLVPALGDLKNTIEETNQIKVDFIAHGLTHRLDNRFEISLYKIIQELINNILKHAEAGKIIIQLVKSNSGINVMVEDDGIGFDVHHRKSSGMGLANVASRVDALEGALHIDSTPGNGTIITIDLPLIND